MPCIAEYSAPSSSLTLLVIREKVAEGIQSKVYATSTSSDLTYISRYVTYGGSCRVYVTGGSLLFVKVVALQHFTRVLATE